MVAQGIEQMVVETLRLSSEHIRIGHEPSAICTRHGLRKSAKDGN